MKIIKVDGICDKYVAYYLSKYNVPFERLTLKKNRGKENFTLRNTCEIKKQIGRIEQDRRYFICFKLKQYFHTKCLRDILRFKFILRRLSRLQTR